VTTVVDAVANARQKISDTASKAQDRVARTGTDLETTIERNPLVAVLIAMRCRRRSIRLFAAKVATWAILNRSPLGRLLPELWDQSNPSPRWQLANQL